MKKEYVKPTIEGEAFVANEYVAACWTVTCVECGALDQGYDLMKNNYLSGADEIGSYDMYTYQGKVGGKDPCRSSTTSNPPAWVSSYPYGRLIWAILKLFGAQDEETTTTYHTIEFTDKWLSSAQPWGNHPNASV